MSGENRQLTTAEACQLLGVSRATLYRMHARKLLKSTKLLRTRRWPLREIERLKDRNTR